jgi:hypothetical protein
LREAPVPFKQNSKYLLVQEVVKTFEDKITSSEAFPVKIKI